MQKKLNNKNYYDNWTDWQYMSASLFKKFLKCEASALDELKNPLKIESVALAVGNYVHSYFESKDAHDKFCDANKDLLFTKSGSKRAETKKGDEMIAKLDSDDLFHFIYLNKDCQQEVILTGELFGYKWKARIDSLNITKGYFCDIKTTADLHKKYWSVDKREWVSFIENQNYALQMGIYKRLLQQKYKKPFKCFIFGVDKTPVVDLAAIEISNDDMNEQLELVENQIDRIESIIAGEIEPIKCGRCDFCKSHKKLTGFISPHELILGV